MAPGARLGPYEIVAPIGKGGMGEVWKARDTKLGRDVALKILPAAFAFDPDRMARFEREARVLDAQSPWTKPSKSPIKSQKPSSTHTIVASFIVT